MKRGFDIELHLIVDETTAFRVMRLAGETLGRERDSNAEQSDPLLAALMDLVMCNPLLEECGLEVLEIEGEEVPPRGPEELMKRLQNVRK